MTNKGNFSYLNEATAPPHRTLCFGLYAQQTIFGDWKNVVSRIPTVVSSVSDPYSLNTDPDPAFNLNFIFETWIFFISYRTGLLSKKQDFT